MTDTTLTPVQEEWTYRIPSYRWELFTHKLDVENRRLARAGVDSRFSATYSPFTVKRMKGGIELPDGTLAFGTEVTETWYLVTMDAFTITLGHYTFVAALVAEEAGYTVHCAPGQSLDGWKRPDVNDIHCDHCGTKRNRNRLYIIRDEDTDQLLQVGHSCIELYTGLNPKGLNALTFDAELQGFADEDNDGHGFGSHDYGIPINTVLGYGFAFSDRGRSYVSAKAAEFGPTPSTSSEVRQWIINPPSRPSGRWATPQAIAEWEMGRDNAIQGDKYAQDEELMADIRTAAETLKAGTDYAENMAIILAGQYVSGRNVGILASLVSVYAREKELAVQRASAPKVAKGFLADVKTRIRDEIRFTLRTVRIWDGDYGSTTFMVGYTPDMHCVVWKASGWHDVEAGDTVVLSAATVKAHEQYGETNPIDQTVLTRAVIKEVIKN